MTGEDEVREALAEAQIALGHLLSASRAYLVSGRRGPHWAWAHGADVRDRAIAALDLMPGISPDCGRPTQGDCPCWTDYTATRVARNEQETNKLARSMPPSGPEAEGEVA